MATKICPVCDTVWDTQRKTCPHKKCSRAILRDITTEYRTQLHKEAEQGRELKRQGVLKTQPIISMW